jgi:hypothetical protein
MTQHVDEVARAIRDENDAWVFKHGGFNISIVESRDLARAAMRAVLKQLREPSEAMLRTFEDAGWHGGIDGIHSAERERGTSVLDAFLDAYINEAKLND